MSVHKETVSVSVYKETVSVSVYKETVSVYKETVSSRCNRAAAIGTHSS